MMMRESLQVYKRIQSKLLGRKAIVGLGTTIPNTAGLVPGVKIGQFGNDGASAQLINIAGVATVGGPNDMTIINPGVGYTPSNGSLVYSDVPMITETGEGSEAVGNVTV